MKFEHTLRYDAPPHAVFAMLGDAVFREHFEGMVRSLAVAVAPGASSATQVSPA